MKVCPRPSGYTSDSDNPFFKVTTSIAATNEVVWKDYQSISLGFVTLTRGPVTVNSAPC